MTHDNAPLLLDFDADWRNAHPDVAWYSIATCEHDAAILEGRRAAEVGLTQHSAGFAACIRGAEFDNAQSPAWVQGWLDAYDLGELAPLVWLRQEAEA
jgi:hypothetical protein